jgi:hypothetical protein
LPKKWKPGRKPPVRSKHWLAELLDGNLPEVKQSKIVDVPCYANGNPGALSVVRNANQRIGVVLSDLKAG